MIEDRSPCATSLRKATIPLFTNLRRAGAVFVGRTNAPCYLMRWFTENTLYGRTLNPWNAAKTPGGSSGGASAALAAGIGSMPWATTSPALFAIPPIVAAYLASSHL